MKSYGVLSLKAIFSLILTYVLTSSAKIIKNGTSEKKSDAQNQMKMRNCPVQNGTSGHSNVVAYAYLSSYHEKAINALPVFLNVGPRIFEMGLKFSLGLH